MSKVAQLKKKAAEFELKKQFDKALALYVEILDGYEQDPEEVDVALFNRVGDLMLRQGNVADAIDYYERAVDLYADGGFFNNAIALCNKILRQTPGRASIYYKLGKISAQKGFKSDAKRNFLEYADRMQKGGRLDEAFRALKEFADLCPDQDDIRLMLADQLSKQDRTHEAIEQLQTLYERYAESGREAEARATVDRMRAIDPEATPKATGGMRTQRAQDLVFLDLDEAPMRTGEMRTMTHTDLTPAPDVGGIERSDADPSVELSGLTTGEFERTTHTAPLEGLTGTGDFDLQAGSGSIEAISGLEQSGVGEAPGPRPASGPLSDLEPTTFDVPGSTPDLEPPLLDVVSEGDLDIDLAALKTSRPDEMPAGEPTRPSGSLDFGETMLEDGPLSDWRGPRERAEPTPTASTSAVDGLPLMDLEIPTRAKSTTGPVGGVGRLGELEIGTEFSIPTRDTPDEAAIPGITPTSVAPHTRAIRRSVDDLRAAVEREPTGGALRRELGEALLETGERDDGLDELERSMTAFERADDLDTAASVADEIVRANPASVRMHQKRVEYAFRTNDKPRLVDAYLDLANALLQSGQAEKARAVYQRILDLSPDEPRAAAALLAFAPPEPAVLPASAKPARDVLGAARGPVAPAGDFVNLGDMLRDEPSTKSTRMVVEEREPSGDEEADFADMLKKFKQGIAEAVSEEDHQSHYDLGIAFKEMGLIDEAISEFQKALRAPANRVPTYEALGQCFVEKEQYQLASTVLGRALQEPGVTDDALIGVLYLLGRAAEAQGRPADALAHYQRVFVLDIQFRDVARRISDVEQATA